MRYLRQSVYEKKTCHLFFAERFTYYDNVEKQMQENRIRIFTYIVLMTSILLCKFDVSLPQTLSYRRGVIILYTKMCDVRVKKKSSGIR